MTLLSRRRAADRGVGVRHVGDGHEHGVQVGLDLLDLRFQAGDLLAQLAPSAISASSCRVLLLGNQLGDLVLPLLQCLRLLNVACLRSSSSCDDAVDVGL